MRRPRLVFVSAVVAVLLGAGVGALVLRPAPQSGVSASAQAPAAPAVEEFPLEADWCYVDAMIPHHEQALELSRLVLAVPEVHPRVSALADFIVTDQQAEIEAMTAWRDAWRSVSPASVAAAPAQHDHATAPEPETQEVAAGCSGHADHASMEGMATPDQLAALGAATGLEAQLMFLDLMIVHHEGALEMAETAVKQGGNAFVRSSAKHVLIEQEREVQAMLLLADDIG